MNRSLVALALSLPSVALAQPGASPPSAPADPNAQPPPGYAQPAQPGYAQPAQPGYAPPPPGYAPPPPGYRPPPPGYAPPPYGAPGYAPGYQPYTPPPPASWRHGVTFEANLGLGVAWARADGENSDGEGAWSIGLGLGGWLTDKLALSLRLAESGFSPESDDVTLYSAFVGPSLQLWTDDHFWIGGGVGIAVFGAHVSGADSQPDPERGLGFDLRAGYTFTTSSANTFNLSVELTPSFFRNDDGFERDVNVNVFSVLLGYQHL